jgi:hypothetical protein
MTAGAQPPTSDIRAKTRNVGFVLLSIAVFLLKHQYAGPLQDAVYSYLGNISVSFALYFVFMNLQLPARIKKLAAALAVLAVVELFEAFNGFGVMANTYDPIDFIANAVGVSLALGLDILLESKRSKSVQTEAT